MKSKAGGRKYRTARKTTIAAIKTMSICLIMGSSLPNQVSGSSTLYEEAILAGLLKPKTQPVIPITVKPKGTTPAKRRSEDQAKSFSPFGLNTANAITAGISIAKSVIQGFICTEPKQPQNAAPS